MSDNFVQYRQQWLKQHKSVLSNRYNKPKKYSGSEKFVNGEFIAHTHLKENSRRLAQLMWNNKNERIYPRA